MRPFSYMATVRILKLGKLNINILLLLHIYSAHILVSPNVPITSFMAILPSGPGPIPEAHITVSCRISFVSFNLKQAVSQPFFVFHDVNILKQTGHVFCFAECSSVRDRLIVALWFDSGCSR